MLHLVSYIHNTLVAENVPKGALGGRSCVSDTQAGFTGTARHEFPVKHCHFLDNAMPVVLQRKMLHLVSYIHNTLVAENVPKGGLGGRSCVSDTQAGFTGTARYEFQVKHCRFHAIVGR